MIPGIDLIVIGFLILFGVGAYALLTRSNLLQMIVGMQILTKAGLVAIVWAANRAGQPDLGQVLGMIIIAADTVTVILAVALALQIYKRYATLDIRQISRGDTT
jgi:NADH:ubiquinone oxidoreductase subunit K